MILLVPNTVSGKVLEGKFYNINEQVQDYNQFRGKPLLIEAFQTGCSHCQDQHEGLSAFYNGYNDSFYLISLSVFGKDDFSQLNQWNDSYPTNWIIGKDDNSKFVDTYDIWATPTFVLFDENGNYVSCRVGVQSESALKQDMDTFLFDTDSYSPQNPDQCPTPTFWQRFFGSIFFPISLMTLFIVGYVVYRRFIFKKKTD